MRPSHEPNLMRLYLRHCAIGFALSAVFVGLILWYDVAGLGHLVMASDAGLLAVFLLWFFNGTVFGSVQFAISIMLMQDSDSDDSTRRGLMVPVRLEERSKRRSF